MLAFHVNRGRDMAEVIYSTKVQHAKALRDEAGNMAALRNKQVQERKGTLCENASTASELPKNGRKGPEWIALGK